MRRAAAVALLLFLHLLTMLALPVDLLAARRPAATHAPSVEMYTTLPWITGMARFLAGGQMIVRPISAWGENGAPRRMARVREGALVVALDPKDAASHGISARLNDIRTLYANFPVPDDRRVSISFDPSALPFLSQRMLAVLSSIDPGSYPFYQRRLAEFQSRIEITIDVGHSLIGRVKLLDMSGAVGPWAAAAAESCARPPADLWSLWISGGKLPELAAAVDEARKRGLWILIDVWTPAVIRNALKDRPGVILVREPAHGDIDYFSYMEGIYRQMDAAITGATPPPKEKRN